MILSLEVPMIEDNPPGDCRRIHAMRTRFNHLCCGVQHPTLVRMAPDVYAWYKKFLMKKYPSTAKEVGIYFKGAKCIKDKNLPHLHIVFLGKELNA